MASFRAENLSLPRSLEHTRSTPTETTQPLDLATPEGRALSRLRSSTIRMINGLSTPRLSVAEHTYGAETHKLPDESGQMVEVPTQAYMNTVWDSLDAVGIHIPRELGDATLPEGQFREDLGSYESDTRPGLVVDVSKVRNVGTEVNLHYMVHNKRAPRVRQAHYPWDVEDVSKNKTVLELSAAQGS